MAKAKTIREQAIELLETLSEGNITTGKKQKNVVSNLSKEGQTMVVELVRDLGKVNNFEVTEKTTDDEILKAFRDTKVADLAETLLASFRALINDVFAQGMTDVEKTYGIQQASQMRAVLEVVIDDIVFGGDIASLMNNEKELLFRIMDNSSKLGMVPADFTEYNKESKYYEKTKEFNARQMVNYLEVNGAI